MNTNWRRRDFLGRTIAASAALPFALQAVAANSAAKEPEIVVFTKVYQELGLNFADAAALTAEAGLQGVDTPVRPGGEVLPERVTEDLPKYAELLKKSGLTIPLLTTAITGIDSPHTEQMLRTAKQLGTRWYRLGFVYRDQAVSARQQIQDMRPRLKELAALNKQIGIGALIQNHSPAGKSVYLAGDLSEMRQLVEDFDPEQIGVAFDIGHALSVHGSGWREHFEALRPHFKIAYVKDITKERKWVALGEGEIKSSGYFGLLKSLNYSAPFSLHIEYDWHTSPEGKTRKALLEVIRSNSKALRAWAA